jgi:hypothetical protein
MRSPSAGRLAQIVDARTPIVEPLAIVAISSLLTAWAMQPFVGHALVQQGSVAQGAAQAALWLAGVLAPVMALAKASMAALVCWSGAVYLGERLSLVKLISLFCVAETISALRDLTMLSVLAVRGIDSVRTTADLMVAFGVNAYLRSPSALARVAFESWDLFTVAWALLAFWMIRALFRTDRGSAACLAVMVFAFRTLFAAASLLYRL